MRQAIDVSAEFPGGAGILRDADEAGVTILVPSDPPSTDRARGYDYYFCVRLHNPGSPRDVRFEALRAGRHQRLWRLSRVPLFVSADTASWYVVDAVESDPAHEEFRCEVLLDAGQSLYVTNSLPCPSRRMHQWMTRVAIRHESKLTIQEIGRSIREQPILLATITDPDVPPERKDRVLVTSGFHPAEADWLAATAIIEAVTGDAAWAHTLCRHYIIDVVPQVNPDGFDLGTNACNAHGVNLYWDFRVDDERISPEATALWRWIAMHPPALYVDFHAYVHQLHKNYRPYIRPKADYPSSARPVACAIDRALVGRCGGRAVLDTSTNDQRTLAAQMTAAFGTVTYPKFHLHLNHGVPAARELAIDVFRAVAETALPFRPLAPRTQPERRLAAADGLLRWSEQGALPLRLRRAAARLATTIGARPRVVQAVPPARREGLSDHWRQHLWSKRYQAQPVITIPACQTPHER